jgi:hypothetical protein
VEIFQALSASGAGQWAVGITLVAVLSMLVKHILDLKKAHAEECSAMIERHKAELESRGKDDTANVADARKERDDARVQWKAERARADELQIALDTERRARREAEDSTRATIMMSRVEPGRHREDEPR